MPIKRVGLGVGRRLAGGGKNMIGGVIEIQAYPAYNTVSVATLHTHLSRFN